MIDPTLEFLYGLHNRGIKLGLKNIEGFLTDVGESWLIPNKPSHDKD